MKLYAAMTVTLALLTSGCANMAAYGTETERTICRELREALPTWSSQDTLQSREEGDRFLTVFEAVCT